MQIKFATLSTKYKAQEATLLRVRAQLVDEQVFHCAIEHASVCGFKCTCAILYCVIPCMRTESDVLWRFPHMHAGGSEFVEPAHWRDILNLTATDMSLWSQHIGETF